MREKNSTYLYIGNVTNGFTDANQTVDYTTLPAGSLALMDATGLPVCEEDALESAKKYCIVAKTANGEIRKSPAFTKEDILSSNLVNYLAPAQQVSYLGYNGTTVSGLGTTFVLGDSYRLLFQVNQTQSVCNTTPELFSVPYYATDTTEITAVNGFYDSFYRVIARKPYKDYIKCDRIANGTYTNATGWTLVQGSKTITKTGHGLTPAAGVTLRIATSDPSAVTTTAIYKVVSYTANTIVLDRPYLGTASASSGHVSYATVAPTAYALKFYGVGVTPSTFNPILDTYSVMDFNIMQGDIVASEYKATKPSRGVGSYMEIAQLENLHQGEDRHYYADSMTTRREFTASSSKTYDVLTLNLRNQSHESPATGISEYSYATIILAIDHGLSYEELNAAFGLTAITLT